MQQATCLATREVPFKTFWHDNRFGRQGGATARGIARQVLDGIAATPGGLVATIQAVDGDRILGSILAFHDPAYHSHGRRGIGCFGLVDLRDDRDTATLDALLQAARDRLHDAGIGTIRGPVNLPRFLFGYGCQAAGFDRPAIAGVSSDPPALHDRFLDSCQGDGTLHPATTYEAWAFDTTRTAPAIAAREQALATAGVRLVHPDFDHPGDLPDRLASLFNESMGTRPDGFDMTPAMVGGYVSLYKLVPGGERLLGFLRDDRDDLAGAIIMTPDWFQALQGRPITGLACDTMAIAPGHRGKGLSVAFFQACAAAVDHLAPSWFEYVYTTPANDITTRFGATLATRAKRFTMFEGGTA